MLRRLGTLFLSVVLFAGLATPVTAGTLSCSITTAAACVSPSVIALRLSGAVNAHAELPSQSTGAYASNVMCCGGVTGLANTCAGTNATVAKLSSVTNSHAEMNTQSLYTNNACLSVPAGGTVTIGYQATNCTTFDTTLGSLVATTNSHVGDTTSYTTKICGTAASSGPTLSFSISDSSIGFGTITSSATRYATGNTIGSLAEVEAHQITANTTSGSGYTMTVQGATLSAGTPTISAIGSTNTAPVTSVEQYGLRMTATGGVGTVSVPYAAAGFAYAATASTQSEVASATTGDGVTTTYSVRYVANVAPQTEGAVYGANMVYVLTANF